MEQTAFINSSVFQWVVVPALIFFARICDVSLDTLRIMLMSRGRSVIIPVIGFFQILIWLLAFRQIVLNLYNPVCYLAFAAGFACGSYVGMYIEERLAIGFQVIRVITRKDAAELLAYLREKNYGVTSVDGWGSTGKVNIIYMVVKRAQIPRIVEIINRFNPKAFYTIEDIRFMNERLVLQGEKNFSQSKI